MIYKAPKDGDGNQYWVPVAAKNKDYLIGYLKGVRIIKDILYNTFKNLDINLDLDVIDLVLDSSRFNDILENGKRESDMNESEKRKFILDMIKDKTNRINNNHIENLENNDDLLTIECTCGLGFYSWDNEFNIPATKFNCNICGKLLIDYTGCNDYEYIFDEGDNNENTKEN